MTMIEELSLEHCPVDRPVYVALFKDVRNAAVLRQHLLSGNEAFEYAFIDASVVCLKIRIVFLSPLLSPTFPRLCPDYIYCLQSSGQSMSRSTTAYSLGMCIRRLCSPSAQTTM